MKRKFYTIPPISVKRKITTHLNWTHWTQKISRHNDVGKSDRGLGQAHKFGGVKPIVHVLMLLNSFVRHHVYWYGVFWDKVMTLLYKMFYFFLFCINKHERIPIVQYWMYNPETQATLGTWQRRKTNTTKNTTQKT